MKKIYFVCPKFLYKNDIFNLESSNNWDNALYPYYLLKQQLLEKGALLNTYDYFKKTENDYALIFQDFRRNTIGILKNHPGVKKFLIEYESPIKSKGNQKIENHQYFEKIFTWKNYLVDNKKYFRLDYARKIPDDINFDLDKKNKLCVAIFGNKLQTHPKELYSERVKAIRWFEKNHPGDFDLYGVGWNEYYFKDKLFHLNRIKLLKKILKPNFPSYSGPIDDKKTTYKNYKFAICYENSAAEDYITEKIFDCFLAGCVPIYLGAPNVEKYIPKETFIDKRNFKNYQELYVFLKNMPDSEYKKYIEAIKNFVLSDKIYPFSAEYFAKTLTTEIIKSLN